MDSVIAGALNEILSECPDYQPGQRCYQTARLNSVVSICFTIITSLASGTIPFVPHSLFYAFELHVQSIVTDHD
jgi:hypothetical protein